MKAWADGERKSKWKAARLWRRVLHFHLSNCGLSLQFRSGGSRVRTDNMSEVGTSTLTRTKSDENLCVNRPNSDVLGLGYRSGINDGFRWH